MATEGGTQCHHHDDAWESIELKAKALHTALGTQHRDERQARGAPWGWACVRPCTPLRGTPTLRPALAQDRAGLSFTGVLLSREEELGTKPQLSRPGEARK